MLASWRSRSRKENSLVSKQRRNGMGHKNLEKETGERGGPDNEQSIKNGNRAWPPKGRGRGGNSGKEKTEANRL